MKQDINDIQDNILQYVDQIKDLLSPELWQNILMDCSKNELFVLWFLYRNKQVNMTMIADYIHVPLNTATGIVGRMEKKKLIIREHSPEDKRVVTISLDKKGKEQLDLIMQEIFYYVKEVFTALDESERTVFHQVMNKILMILHTPRKVEPEKKKIKKIRIE